MSDLIHPASTAALSSSQTPRTPPGPRVQGDRSTTLLTESPQPEGEGFSTAEEEQSEMEDGELTRGEVAKHLSTLGPSGQSFAYQILCVSRKNLKNVSILCDYIHLRKLELPHNKIKDLSCVSHMPNLIILDASHNELSNFFGFQPPKYLKEVNLSHNQISEMKDLSSYLSLCKLILDYNSICEIKGLEKCSSLLHFSIAHNKISRISGLNNLPLKHLCLSGNLIKKIENLHTLRALQVLDLSSNRIHCLSGLQNLPLLGSINFESNMISEIKEVSYLHGILLLRELNLKRNPVQEQPDYRLMVIFLLNCITELDEQAVTAEDKVTAVNKYDPPLEVVAARDHMNHIVYQHMQPQVIFDSACHTTRGPYFGEEDGSDYHFVLEEEFQNMISMGRFVQTMQYGGHWYGFSREAIESAAREGLACCVHMELEGVYSLKNSYFEPRYILLIPTSTEGYISRMKARGLYSNTQIDTAVSRIDLYIRVNREQPGFFDSVIPSDNQEEAYRRLRQLVKEFLGLHEQSAGGGDSARVIPHSSPQDIAGASLATEKVDVNPIDTDSINYWNKVQTRLTPQKTSAELASIHRKKQLLREALMGKSTGVYPQLFKRYAHTAPSLLGPHSQPGGSSSLIPNFGRPLSDRIEDSSSEESRASSGLSVHSSAGALSTGSPAEGLDAGSGAKVEPLDISMLGQNLESLKDQMTPDAPRSVSERASPTLTTSPGRPGSNAKPILPPIPSGRKAAKPGPRQ
ncbi:leucine-rich repeat and guanylate kinase domain-containing protein isoform X2 [Salminus brasiliensis]|uniref:leucine-rich repeat and guanylate kinase domain-containing protein isoform X2 n=1 Tax=Salminus brasiliensis TaxID=930266 RepID=UPI003B82F103